ncbi:MAG: hypothetical protein WBB28_01915 [Crinalium sp.]
MAENNLALVIQEAKSFTVIRHVPYKDLPATARFDLPQEMFELLLGDAPVLNNAIAQQLYNALRELIHHSNWDEPLSRDAIRDAFLALVNANNSGK